MTAVKWEALDPHTYEDIVAALLGTLDQDAERIDGSGGDGGRDVQVRREAGADWFELKSFTGRLDARSGRRRNVERSLERAAASHPLSWTLVVPIDPTPDELLWFDHVGGGHSFPTQWRGRTWLDGQMANNPALTRYYLAGGADEALQLLSELNLEQQAALARGVPDAVERLRTLTRRVNELDPHYRFELATYDDTVMVSVRPRYRSAVIDRPISGSVGFTFPDTREGRAAREQLLETINYGVPGTFGPEVVGAVTLDLPGGLGGEFEGGTILLSSAEDEEFRINARLSIVDAQSNEIVSLPLLFDERRRGERGADLTGRDPSGALISKIRFDTVGGRANVNFLNTAPQDALPSAVLPALRVLRALTKPNVLRISFAGAHEPARWRELFDEEFVSQPFVELMEAFNRVQVATGVFFPIGPGFTPADVANIHLADALLRDQPYQQTWESATFELVVSDGDAVDQFREMVEADDERPHSISEDSLELAICGQQLRLGPIVVRLDAARVSNREQILGLLPLTPGDAVKLDLVPGTSAVRTVSLAG